MDTINIRHGYETKEFDYKGPMSWDDSNKEERCKLVKDVLAMANTNGGIIVFGVSENENKTYNWEGLSPDQLKTFDTTKINQFLQKYSEPPINTYFKIQNENEKFFGILQIPQFKSTPHLCKSEFPNILRKAALYIRSDNNESIEIVSTKDFSELIEKAIRNRSNQLVSMFSSILKHGITSLPTEPEDRYLKDIERLRADFDNVNPYKNRNRSYREIIIYPSQYVERRYQIKELTELAQQISVEYRGWPMLFCNKFDTNLVKAVKKGIRSVIISREDDLFGAGIQFWELEESGLIYIIEELWEDRYCDLKGIEEKYISYEIIAYSAIECLLLLNQFFEKFENIEQEVSLQFALKGVKDKFLKTSSNLGFSRMTRFSSSENDIEYNASKSIANWRILPIDNASEIAEYILQRMNFFNPSIENVKYLMSNLINRKV